MNEQTKLLIWLFLLITFLSLYYFIIQKWFETNNEKVLYILLIVTIIFSPPFVWYTVSLKSSFGFILPEHIDAWIGFYGAVIGGSLTLFGVWWTITDQKKIREDDQELRDKERKENLAIEYKPHFSSPTKVKISSQNFNDEDIYSNSAISISQKITLLNCGRGEAVIKKISSEAWYVNTNDICIFYTKNKDEIFPEEELEVNFKFDIYNFIRLLEKDFHYTYVYTIIYTDLFDQYEYKKDIFINIKKEYYSLSEDVEWDDSLISTELTITIE